MRLKAESLNKQIDIQRQKVEALKQKYEQSAKTKGADDKATQNLAIRYNRAQAELSRLENELRETNNTIEQQTNRWNKLSNTMQNVGNKIKSVGNKMKDVGKSLTTKVTMPLAGIGAVSVKTAIDFEASMSEVKAITGATGEEFEKLENLAKQMGANTSKSATESAQAIKYMGLAGWDTTQIMEGLEPILRLSEAGNLDLARASDLVTDSMSALGITTKELPTYLDQLAQTSRSSNTNIDALAEAFILAGGSFKNLNTPLDEANALLGILANRGIKGSEAGNSLNSILINLTSGAGQAGKAMQELGLSAFDNEGKFKGITVVLQELRQKLSGMTEEQKNTYLAMIGGKTQISTLNALLDGLGNEYESLRNKIQNSNGALNDMATTMQDNLKGKITKLKSALEGAALSIADTLIPIVEKATAIIQKITDKFNSLSPAQQELIVKICLLVAAIGPALLVFGQFAGAIGNVINVGGKLITHWGTISSAATKFAGFLKPLLGGLFTPWGLAIAGAIAAGILIYKNWDKIKEGAKKLKENLSEKFNNIKESISDKWNKLKENTAKTWQFIQKKIDEHGGGIKGVIGTYVEGYKTVWKNTFNVLDKITGGKMSSITNTISKSVSNIKNKMINTWNNIKNSLTQTWNNLKSSASNIFKNIASAIVKPFKNIHIPMPHFKFSVSHKEIAGINIAVPKVNVDWYDKGGIFTRPNIIGVGEKRPEFVGALEDLRYLIRDELTRNRTVSTAGGINITVQNMSVRNDSDIRRIAEELHVLTQNSLRARGIG
ncbi:phage tail tape measure protein [Caminicella sporogenes]|uniref:phage tail tape measure protein n=1 Tax=Caminicella sporogenes TaxID=166485 RepID=UPI0025425E5E|nr:phage tail tape measure protein [Caminicella sporogenes]WIF94311.1 phage tail tape measure protein [Caminicella sporogenes]